MNSYLNPNRCKDMPYMVYCTKQYKDGRQIDYVCLYTKDIIQPYQYPKVFKYYVYLRKGTRNKIDYISTDIKDGCVGTIICPNPIKLSRTTFATAHGSASRPAGINIRIDMDPLYDDDDQYQLEFTIDELRLEALSDRDTIAIDIGSLFDYIEHYRFDDDYIATAEFCESTKGSYRIAQMIEEDIGSSCGSIMATAHRIKTNKSKCFAIKYVWVDEYGVFDYRGAIDDHGIIFDCKFLDEEIVLTESQYNTIVEKWKNKWPNR